MIKQSELQRDIYNLSAKIAQLKYIHEQQFSEINILVHFTDSIGYYRVKSITQDAVPFSLQCEIRLLLQDSIEELERQLASLKTLVK